MYTCTFRVFNGSFHLKRSVYGLKSIQNSIRCLNFASTDQMEVPIIEVKQGKLRGKISENVLGGNFYSFQGIPYAKPPVGDLRFKAPQKPEVWDGVRDALEDGNICYSRDLFLKTIRGSEDCLYLNVYTPQLPKSSLKPKPVMFWIHGGAFTTGSGEKVVYGPDYLIKEDIVLVTINYRLGVLGFANFQDSSLDVPGNAGLKDMVMALKWVNENILAFNGDPKNITIFGESAGGAAVHFLMLSPIAKNLFHKAIAQSGSALNPWARGKPSAELFAKVLNIDNWNEKKVLDTLKSISVEELYKAQEEVKDHFRSSERRPFGPVIESSENPNSFISEEPLAIIKKGTFSKIPFMTGYTSREGMLYASEHVFNNREIPPPSNLQYLVPFSYNFAFGSEESKRIADQLKQFYYGADGPSAENMDSTYQVYTDSCFFRGIYEGVREQILVSKTPIYFYRFSFDGKMNLMKRLLRITEPGTSHADELPYLFSMPLFLPDDRKDSPEFLTLKRLTKIWTSFARNGNPDIEHKDYDLNWKPVEKDKLHYAEIGENITIGVNPDAARMAFWDRIAKTSSKL